MEENVGKTLYNIETKGIVKDETLLIKQVKAGINK